MKIISLVEDTSVSPEIGTEHGLSLYIEHNDIKILFDFGDSDLFIQNAEKLGVHLNEVDFAVISHGHINHGRGLESFFKLNHTAKVCINKYTFEPHFDCNGNSVGLDSDIFYRYRDRFVIVDDDIIICAGIYIFNCNNNDPIYSQSSNQLLRGIPGNDGSMRLIPDDFKHEQYLYLKSSKDVLLSGSSHKGILNIMSWCNPDVFLTGFNFLSLPITGDDGEKNKREINDIAQKLKNYKCKYYTYHSTGMAQFNYLKSILGEQLEYLGAGAELEV